MIRKGRVPYDTDLMFKILILQSLYNLSDEAMEYQVRDRLSFMRFLNLAIEDSVPDARTIWFFREQLKEFKLVEKLFADFDSYLAESGFEAKKGQIIDASIAAAPKQRNSREENGVFEEILDKNNTGKDVFADSAYRSKESLKELETLGFREHLQRKGCKNKKLNNWEKQGNHTRSKIRSRIEHVFGVQAQRAKTLIIRTIGIIRADIKIGLRNLAYNMQRL